MIFTKKPNEAAKSKFSSFTKSTTNIALDKVKGGTRGDGGLVIVVDEDIHV